MAVSFLTAAQRARYGRYPEVVTPDDLARCFHLSDDDRAQIESCRGHHNRLGFALQLSTVRYLGTFLEDPIAVPSSVLQFVSRQLAIHTTDGLERYRDGEQREEHVTKIRKHYGYGDIAKPRVGFRMTRWLYGVCWTGTERLGALFERATAWLLAHKILLPGVTTMERFVVSVRARVEARLYGLLSRGLTAQQKEQLQRLLLVPDGDRVSVLDQIRSGPTRISGPAIRAAIDRLNAVRALGISIPMKARIPSSRIASLARFANRAKAQAISRMPELRRLATLVAFVHCLEATAQDEVLEVLEMQMNDLFGKAITADQKARLRALKDLDESAVALAEACHLLLDPELPDESLRQKVFAKIPRAALENALERVTALIRPPDDIYNQELSKHYRSVRGYLPHVLTHISFEAAPAGRPLLAACDWLRNQQDRNKPDNDAPREFIDKAWQRYVVQKDGRVDLPAYTFCVLKHLQTAIHRRDVFTRPSWRYADPRANLFSDAEWEATRPIVCRTLGLPPDPQPLLDSMAEELDKTYREVAQRLPDNPDVRFEKVNGKEELILTPLDALEEPPSLIQLRKIVADRLPRVELAELVLEVALRTGFTEAFTHLTDRAARTADFVLSLCAALLAEACNTGPEPFIRHDTPALRRDRIAWVKQNYLRDETITAGNATLVAAQNRIALAHAWGGGEIASADGMRFVVPIRTVHAGPNPKYFGQLRGMTWYNLLSDQFTGLNAIPVPGTMRDSLVLLAVVLEQQTELKPTRIMTDTGAYSDVMFGLFRHLGFRFCPRLADIGGTRFWRIDPRAAYGKLNAISQHQLKLQRITPHWDDMLRLSGSLLQGRVPAAGIMRTLQVGDNPTRLAQAIAEFGRIDKTLHSLRYIDDKDMRRGTLTQLNRTEGRHSVARIVFSGKRGELRQRYREGQEDQLGALGLVVNMIVLWNTIYMEAVLEQLRKEGYAVNEEDKARLSPLIHDHINTQGRHSFTMPEAVVKGELRPLRNPADDPD
ncbi:MAG TPA: Tn3 family transposase [Terracidiphilus sp.]